MSAYEEGQAAHAAGTLLTANPNESGSDMSDWAAGWSDAQAEATGAPTAEAPTAEDPVAEEPIVEAPVAEEPATPAAEESAAEVVASLGDAGYARIMDLLSNPPVDGVTPGTLPPSGEVPEDLSEWLEAWKAPLAFVAVDTALSVVKTRLGGSSRGRLKELYRGMSPMDTVAAMQANAKTISGIADQRVAEAALISSLQASVTQRAAGFLLNALLLI